MATSQIAGRSYAAAFSCAIARPGYFNWLCQQRSKEREVERRVLAELEALEHPLVGYKPTMQI